MNRPEQPSEVARARAGRRRFLQMACGGLLGIAAAPLVAGCDVDLPHVVQIDDERGFNPGALTIPKGATVRWKNMGAFAHSVTDDPAKAQNKSNAALPAGAPPWDSGPLYAGQTWTQKFDVPGQYVYFSSLDEASNLVGTITVTG